MYVLTLCTQHAFTFYLVTVGSFTLDSSYPVIHSFIHSFIYSSFNKITD